MKFTTLAIQNYTVLFKKVSVSDFFIEKALFRICYIRSIDCVDSTLSNFSVRLSVMFRKS